MVHIKGIAKKLTVILNILNFMEKLVHIFGLDATISRLPVDIFCEHMILF